MLIIDNFLNFYILFNILRIENLDTLYHSGLYVNDLSMHDASREFVIVGSGQSSDLKSALSVEKQRSKLLEDNVKLLDEEVKRSDNLLYRLLPRAVADRLRNGEPTINMCEVKKNISISLIKTNY